MLLTEPSSLPASTVRTIRLSTESFLGTELYEDSTPLYSLTTTDAQTTLSRYDKKEAEAAPLVNVATVSWSDLESPDSSPVDSPTSFTTRFVKSWTSRDTKEDRNVYVEVDGRKMKQSELLRTSPLGGSRKFTVDGKRFRWKHINGLWQCSSSKKLLAVFEPAILTAPARIRILPSELSITRRIFDMIILTCLLVVTHPGDWRHYQPTKSLSPTPPPLPYRQRSAPEVPRIPSPMPLRRALSYDEGRQDVPLTFHLSIPQRTSSGQTTPTGRVTPPLPRLIIPNSTQEESMLGAWRPIRRVSSYSEFSRAPTPLLSIRQQPSAMTIVERASTSLSAEERRRSLHRSPSASALSTTSSPGFRRTPLGTILSPVADEPSAPRDSTDTDYSASSTHSETPSASRPWERRNAYPVPYSVVHPVTTVQDEVCPPPYSRRDPLAPPPVPRIGTPPRRSPPASRMERMQLVVVS